MLLNALDCSAAHVAEIFVIMSMGMKKVSSKSAKMPLIVRSASSIFRVWPTCLPIFLARDSLMRISSFPTKSSRLPSTR